MDKKMIKRRYKLNKKAQIGEIIQDTAAFLLVIFILLLTIVVSFVLKKQGDDILVTKFNEKALHDKINAYVLAALSEKKGDKSLSDLIRENNEEAKNTLTQEIRKICLEKNQECDVEIINKIECKGSSAFGEYFCYFIPGKDGITIKVFYNYYYSDTLPA